MENSNGAQAQFESSKLVLGKVAAELFDTDVDSLDWDKSFIMLGGDSILAIDFIVRCRDAGIWVDMTKLLTAGSLGGLAEAIDRANGVPVNGANGHTNGNGASGEVMAGEDSNVTKATVARRLRFASMEIPKGEKTSVILAGLGRIVSRHSALRSTWSVSSTGCWTLTTTPASGNKGRQQFYSSETAETKQVTDAFELLREALLSDRAQSLGCLIIPSDAPGSSHTVVLAADSNLVDVISMRLLLRELRAYVNGRQLDPNFDFQFSDWVARGCQERSAGHQSSATSQSSVKQQVEKANTAKSESAADTNASQISGYAEDAVNFTLSHSTSEKLFASQTHAALRTSPVDIINAALSHTIGPLYRDTEDVLTIKSAYSIREEQDIPLDSIGCYEVEVEWEAADPDPRESLVHVARRVRDSRAGFSKRAESTATIYVDCTRLQRFEDDDFSPWLSDPILGEAPYVSAAMVAGQVHVSLNLAGKSFDDQRIADSFKLCLEDMVDELVEAPEMAALRNFPLVHWPYSALDNLVTDLKAHGMALSDVESIGPCSAVQESFFVSQAINPGSYVSHATLRLLPTSADVPRLLEPQRVVSAWRDLVKRHAMLRTTFVESNDRPGKFDQLVLRSGAMPPRVTLITPSDDASTIPPFTTGRFESPLRLCVYEVTAEELRLELEISHALVDGHSAKILLHDIRASYLRTAYFSEHPPLPYTVFASHQQATLSAGEESAGVAYWTSYLNNAGESHLPLVTTNPNLENLETALRSIKLPDGKLRAVCGRFSITPAYLFHIAWALAIRRIILSDTITFSYIVSGRNSDLDGAEATVGPFINTLPFCLALNQETSVADALAFAKQDWQDGASFQNIPIAELAVAKTRSLKRLGNTLLSIEREGSNSHAFTKDTYMALDARTSAADVRITPSWVRRCANDITV